MKKILLLFFLICGSIQGATATYTVASSGGDFTSITEFIGNDTTISANDTVVCSLLVPLDTLIGSPNFDGWSVDTTSYIRFVVGAEFRHAGVLDESKYVLGQGSTSGLVCRFPNSTPAFEGCHIEFEGLQIRNTLAGSLVFFTFAMLQPQMNILLKDCIVTAPSSVGARLANLGSNNNNVHITLENCLVYNLASEVYQNVSSGNTASSLTMTHCTIGDMTQVATVAYGSVTMKNCVAANISNAVDSVLRLRTGGTYDISYTVTEDGSADNYGGTGNKPDRDVFFRDTANGIWLLAVNDTACQGAGDDLTSTIPYDVQGELRSTNPDIGFDEVYYSSIVIDTADMFTSMLQTGPNFNLEQDYNYGNYNQIQAGRNNDALEVFTNYQLFGIYNLRTDINGLTNHDIDSIDMFLNVTVQEPAGTEYYVFREVDTTLLILEGDNSGADGTVCEPCYDEYHTAGGACSATPWTTAGGDVYATRIDSFFVHDTTGLYHYGWGRLSGLVGYFNDIAGGATVCDTVFNGFQAMASLLRIEESTGGTDTRFVAHAENNTVPPAITFYYYGGTDNTPAPSDGRSRKIIIGAF